MPLFGAHMSIAGGLHNALLSAQQYGCATVQLFTKNASQWAARPISPDEIALFRQTLRASKLCFPMAHDSYLINLASPDDGLYRKSIEAFVVELTRAEALGLSYLVMHPGACLDSSEAAGLARVVQALDVVHDRCPDFRVQVLLETTAGQGSCLGHRFEHFGAILAGVKDARRLGVCLDTCHVFAAGYSLATPADYEQTMRAFHKLVGIPKLKAFHLNDSRKPFGSRVDRHAHIGLGELGLEPFRLLVNDPRFRNRPMVLETPKEDVDGRKEMDAVNLNVLRGLLVPS